jgi:hypothetical protein
MMASDFRRLWERLHETSQVHNALRELVRCAFRTSKQGIPWTSMMFVRFETLCCASLGASTSRYVAAMLSRAEVKAEFGTASRAIEAR